MAEVMGREVDSFNDDYVVAWVVRGDVFINISAPTVDLNELLSTSIWHIKKIDTTKHNRSRRPDKYIPMYPCPRSSRTVYSSDLS